MTRDELKHLIDLIVACPRDYNVVIHSFDHPVAAIRGQLGKKCAPLL